MEQTHNEIMRAIGRIEGKIDGILEQATKTHSRVDKLELDVNALQSFRDNLKGKMVVVASVASIVVSFVVKKLLP